MDPGWTLALALLLVVEGHRDDLCPQRDPPPGVMVLTPGSEVLLHCHGDVIVDRVLKVQGNTERPFIRDNQQDAGTTSDKGYLGKTAETSSATYKMETGRSSTVATGDTSRGKYQKETGVTSSDASHEKDRETKPGAYQREIGRTATEGFRRMNGGTSSEGYDESTGGTLKGAYERERRDVTETEPNEYRPTVTTETVTSVNQGETFSTTEWPQMTKMADIARAVSPPLHQDDVKEEGAAARPKRKRPTYWTLDGVVVQGSVEMIVLRLPHLGLRDAGNYSCYREGALMSTVKITLGTPPVSPSLSCYRKSLESKIRCDWTSPQPVVPIPKCYILLERSGQPSREVCSYSVVHSRCWCVLDHEVRGSWGDMSVYTARLCVTNTAGKATSPAIRFTAQNSVKPDPPASLRASEVQGGERMLSVTWSYPASWKRSFYYLRFQLRYRPSHGEKYQTVDTEVLSWTITDALPHTEYQLQLRAIEEFRYGNWSDWTTPVFASTWTAPESTPASDPVDSLDPLWFDEGSGSDEEIITRSAVADDSLNTFGSVFGVFVLAIMLILLSAFVFRHRMRFASKLGKLGSTPAPGDPPAARPAPTLEEEKPLMSPVSPTPSTVTMQHDFPPVQEENSHSVHFFNIGYFLLNKE